MSRLSLLVVLLSSPAFAADPVDAYSKPSDLLNASLPTWMRFSGDYRARFENVEHIRWRPANSDSYIRSRVRFGLELRPLPWRSCFGQAQDARVVIERHGAALPPRQDSLDLRQAYVQFG